MQPKEISGRDTPPAALVRDRRIGVAIGDDHTAFPERGEDRLVQQLHPLCGKEECLCPRFERGTTLVLEHEAVQDLAERRLVRPDGDDVVALLTQRAGKGCDLGALACTVKPFERDEKATPCAHAGQNPPPSGPSPKRSIPRVAV